MEGEYLQGDKDEYFLSAHWDVWAFADCALPSYPLSVVLVHVWEDTQCKEGIPDCAQCVKFNNTISSLRSTIENIFGSVKQHF